MHTLNCLMNLPCFDRKVDYIGPIPFGPTAGEGQIPQKMTFPKRRLRARPWAVASESLGI
jgi:hypothetical protein